MGTLDLSALRVVEVGSRYPAVAIAGSELAAAGARSSRLGEPESDARSTAFGVGKRRLDGPADVRALAGDADVVLVGEDFGRAAAAELAQLTCVGLVSGWGDGSPLAGRPADEVSSQAAAAYLQYLGRSDGRPRRMAADIGSFATAMLLVGGICASLAAGRRRDLVEVAMYGALCMAKAMMWASFSDPSNAQFARTLMGPDRPPDTGYKAADGRVTLDFRPATEQQWRAFVDELGIDDRFSDLSERDQWRRTVGTGDLVARYRAAYEAGLRNLSRAEVAELVQRHGGMCVPYMSYDDLVASAQVEAVRGIETVQTGATTVRRVRPLLDDGEVAPPVRPATPLRTGRVGEGVPPLDGVRVLDFTAAAAGPFAGFLLGRLGADVIKIEPPEGDFLVRLSPTPETHCGYAAMNCGKRIVRLDLRDPRDRAAVRRLAETADVIIENFRAGVMERLGVGFDDLSQVNDHLVFVSMRGYGDSGPLAAERCTDPQMQAFSGLAVLNAGTDGPELFRYAAVIDMCSGMSGATLAVAGLADQRVSHRPLHLSTSMLRVALALQAGPLADALAGEMSTEASGVVVTGPDGRVALGRGTRLGELLSLDGHTLGHSGLGPSELGEIVSARPAAWWLSEAERLDVPAAPWLRDRHVMESPLALEPGWLEAVPTAWGTSLTLSTTPWRFASGGCALRPPAPSATAPDLELAARIRSGSTWPEAAAARRAP